MSVFCVRNLRVCFTGHVAIDNVSLEIPDNGISVIVGRSGSGKSTFLRALNRLNEEICPCETQGEILLHLRESSPCHVQDIPEQGLAELRRTVGMVFQSPEILPCSIIKNITLPLALGTRISSTEALVRAKDSLMECALWEEVADRISAPASILSGGQKQRLCLARSLALRPRVLLLDEPTAALDVHASSQIESLLIRLAEHIPLVMVSHSPSQTLRLNPQKIFVFSRGRLAHTVSDTEHLSVEMLSKIIGTE